MKNLYKEINKNKNKMIRPSTQRNKPINIEENCKCCKQPLTLLDLLDGPQQPDEIWYDEWTCSNEHCVEFSKIFFDWPKEEFEKIQRFNL